MLNTFPSLLDYGFFAPSILRIVAAGVFGYIAYIHYQRRHEIGSARFWLVGVLGTWSAWVMILLESVIALGLLFGFYTQIAALLGALMSLKSFVWAKKYPQVFPQSCGEYALLLVICISLLLTGAGALAIDIHA